MKRPCLDCGRLAAGSRCPRCTRRRERTRAQRTHRPYTTAEYKRWRQCVRERDEGICQGCGITEAAAGRRHHADHIRPVVDGGAPFDARNGQLLCKACHDEKTRRDRQGRAG